MAFFKKLFGKGGDAAPEVPAWASFMGQDQFSRFKVLVEREVRARNPSALFDWGQGSWVTERGSQQTFGLVNLAQICSPLSAAEQRDEVRRFVRIWGQMGSSQEPTAFDEARQILKVRLYYLDLGVDLLAAAPFSDSFRSVLALDLPDMVASVNKDNIAAWGVPVHDLFEIGLNNVFDQDPVEISMIPADVEGALIYLTGDSFFAATHALMLDRHLTFDEDYGVLVIIPNRHFVGCHKVFPGMSADLGQFATMAEGMFAEGPGSITTDVLWFRRGQFEKVDLRDGKAEGPLALMRYLS